MSLSIYNHDEDSSNFKNTPVYGSCSFSLRFSQNGLFNSQFQSIHGKMINEIHGICDDVNSISYSVSWDDGPGAALASKIKEFSSAEAFKLFSGRGYNSNPATGQWTQQYPKEGAGLSVTLKFRAYTEGNFANTTSYLTLIPWLTYITSPLSDFSINKEFENIRDALTNAKLTGETVGNQLNSMEENGRLNWSVLKDVAEVMQGIENKLTQLATSSRSQVTCLLQVGDYIKMNPNIDWVVESWSFIPSMQMVKSSSNSIGMPLYCDFEVTVATNTKLSSDKLKSILR